MRKAWIWAAAAVGLLTAGGASAHHSGAMFDGKKTVTLVGTVKEIKWTNPHSWLELSIPQPDGTVQQWSVEMGWPEVMLRQGFRRNDPKAGDKVTVTAHPLRTGQPAGAFISIKLADGRVIAERQ